MVCNNFDRNRFKCYFTSDDRSLVAQANCHGGRCATQKETLSVLMNSCFFILWQSQIIIYLFNLFLLSLISLRNLRCIIPGFSYSNKLNFIDNTTKEKKVWNLITVRHLPNPTPQAMIIMKFTMHWPTRNGGGVVTGVSPLLNYHKEAKNLLKLKSNYSWKQNITTIKALSSVNSKMSAASIWYLSLYLCRSFPIYVTWGSSLLKDFRPSDKFDYSLGN
mgnify:CR=1 FL=1